MKPNFLLNLLLLLFVSTAFGQQPLTYYLPESKEYGIYYPKDFKLSTQDDIVSFTDPKKDGINISVSSYFFKDKAETAQFITKLSEFTGIKREDWANYKSKFDDLFEGRAQTTEGYWAWWCITKDKHAIAISINKPVAITDEDIKLLRFMIDKLDM
jgi:hypothetical protein